MNLLEKERTINILLIEDSLAVQQTLDEWIKEEIPQAVNRFAVNCEEALLRLFEKVPDIVILELSLPDGSGMDLLRTIRSQFPSVKTIIFTNTSEETYRKNCTNLGVNYFLDKTFDFSKLSNCINSLF